MASHEASVLAFESHPNRKLHLWLYSDVSNAKEIGDAILKKTLPRDYAFINAAYVPDQFIVHLSASKALFAESSKTLRCRSLHGELIVNLSGSNHIAVNLKRFGAADDVENFLVAAFDASDEDVAFIGSYVKGTSQPLSELHHYTNEDQIKKVIHPLSLTASQCPFQIFKLTSAELQIGSLVDAVTCRVAAHDLDKA